MIRFIKSIIARLFEENPDLAPIGTFERRRTRHIPGGLAVTWRVVDRHANGDVQRASGETVVAFMTADQAQQSLLDDLKRIFKPLPGTNILYQVDVRPMVA